MFYGARSLAMVLLLASTALLGVSRTGQAQAATTPSDTLAALLTEVRGLRAAMEQMASAGPRVQLALGRLQLQEQRINTLVRRLEEVRASLASARQNVNGATDQLERFEKASRESTNAELRRDVEAQMARMKREAAQAAADVQRLQSDEAALQQDIANEQGRWTEFNQRLEELERSLVRP